MSASHWGTTPRASIERECARRGLDAVVAGCCALLRGELPDRGLVQALGGPGASKFYDGRPHADTYWLRVWGARGLLWAWDGSAGPELALSLRDEAWRVREMGLKVVGRHLLGDFLPAVARACDDDVPRVRRTAQAVLTRLTSASA